MALIPKQENEQLLSAIEAIEISELPRHYLGMSQIGEQCVRKLQYYWRWASKIGYSQRVSRIFRTGHLAEDFIIHDIHQVGGEVFGRQDEYVGSGGHWKGHGDGKCKHIPGYEDKVLLLEIKTHNDKSFKGLLRDKVEKSKPMHYAQMQRYMHAEDLELGLYYAYNKNTSEYYVEFIPLDRSFAEELIEKEMTVITSDKIYPRIGNGLPNWHECRFCDFKKVCHGQQDFEQNCRTCRFVDILDEGKWSCTKDNQELDLEFQLKGCDVWELDEEYFNG